MALKTYNVPITWKKTTQSNKEVCEGTMSIPYFLGNQINATWKSLSGNGVTKYDELTLYWNWLEVEGTLTQGTTAVVKEYNKRGKYYPNGQTYSFTIDFNTALALETSYKLKLTDEQRMFDVGKMNPNSYIPLEVNSISVEKPNTISFNAKKIYENIVISWQKQSSNDFEVELWQNSNLIWKSALTKQNSVTVPAGTIKTTDSCTVKVRSRFIFLGDTYWSDYTTASLSSLEGLVATKPTNIVTTARKIYENITVSWDNAVNHQYYAEVVIDGKVSITKNWQTQNSFVIPYGTIKNTQQSVSVRVKSKTSVNGYTSESAYTTLSLTSLQALIAEQPKDVRLVGDNPVIEQPIKIAWTNTDMTGVSTLIELWQNGSKIHSKNSILSMEYTIPAGTIQSINQVQVRVYNTKTINGYTHTSTYGSVTLSNLKTYKPAIKDFTLSGYNRDYDITITPDVDRGDIFSLVVNDTVQIDELVIPRGTLKTGRNTIKLIVVASVGLEVPVQAEYQKIIENIVEDVPLIYSLEPSGININIQRINTVTFALNEFCDEWQLFVNNVVIKKGTSDRNVEISENVFITGNNTLTLQVNYTPKYQGANRRSVVKTSTFNGYSKPKPPVLDPVSVYNTATPLFVWNCYDEQDSNVQTEVNIIVSTVDGQSIEERILNQTQTRYQMVNQLLDKVDYVLSIAIRNKYGLWSDFSTKTFATSFNSLPVPQIELISGQNDVTIKVNVYQVENVSDVRIFKKEQYGEWVCIAERLSCVDYITDYTIKSNIPTEYKARLYNLDGAYSECQPKQITIKYEGFLFSNVLKTQNIFKTVCCDVSLKHNRNIKTKVFAGNQRPDIYYDNTNYLTGNFDVQLNSNDLYYLEDLIVNGEIFCYRDWRGRKIYCNIVIDSLDYVKYSNIYNVSLSFIQVNFTEQNMYSKNKVKRIAYLDGKYKLDGSLYLDGYVLEDESEVFFFL